MAFQIKLFTGKRNLFIIMNNLYHKVAVVSVCTALSFTLGANKEAKAATFTLTATKFFIDDTPPPNSYATDGVGDRLLNSRYDNEYIINNEFVLPDVYRFPTVAKEGIEGITERERKAFYEFNIGYLSLAPNTVIRSAIFQQGIEEARRTTGANRFRSLFLEILGYVGDGNPNLSDFGAGVSLGRKDAVNLSDPTPCYPYPYNYCNTEYNGGILSFDVTGFVNERVSNRDPFAGFGIRVYENSFLTQIGFPNRGVAILSDSPYLTIETVDAEPVPEPTTIFGSAIALGVGGWLKRKKSSQQNKTTSQH
jgi:hypothetical protein